MHAQRGRCNALAVHQDSARVVMLHVWKRAEEREGESFADFGRRSLPESLLEHFPAVVTYGHRGFVSCTCKSRATALGNPISKACFEKRKMWEHKDVTFGAYARTPRISRSTMSGILATRSWRAKNGSQENSEVCKHLRFCRHK